MQNLTAERRITNFVLWLFAVAVLVILLTSCSPYAANQNNNDVNLISTPAPSMTKGFQKIENPTPTPHASQSCTVTTGYPAGRVNVRTNPSMTGAVIRTVTEGERLTVLQPGAWMKVQTRNTTGYIFGKYCQ